MRYENVRMNSNRALLGAIALALSVHVNKVHGKYWSFGVTTNRNRDNSDHFSTLLQAVYCTAVGTVECTSV